MGPSFAVAGSGPDEARLRAAIEQRGLGDRFRLLGTVRPIDVFLSAIDVLAIPSRFEGLPLIALEALWLGIPGIATRIDGLVQIWPVAWQVAPSNERELAERLWEVLSTPVGERAALLAEARARAERRVTEDLAPFFAELLPSLVGEPRERA
jgi:glycosyltransferase involved in cell wall biosynthesis